LQLDLGVSQGSRFDASFGGKPASSEIARTNCISEIGQARSGQISLLKGAASGIGVPVQFRGNEQSNPTCAESRVEYWQINALVGKSSLHFLQSCCEAAFFWRESHFVNENHARRHASMPKVVTTCSNHPRAPLNRLIRLTLGLAKFRKPPTNCASWANSL
jgi:hypothetical protein